MSHAAGASSSLVVVGDLIPPALQDARLDEREIRAGLAVFLTIATLRYVASLCELAPSPELPYNGGRNQAAPASPKSIALAAADAEKKQPAGNSETNAADPSGLAPTVSEFTNLPKGYDELLEQWLYPSYVSRDAILNHYHVGVLTPQKPDCPPSPMKAKQGKSVFVSNMDPDNIVGSSGAGPCIIVVIKGPGKGYVRVWHFDAENSAPQTLPRDLGPVPGGHAGIAGNDNTSISNFNLAVVLKTLKDLNITVDGYYHSDELWVDSEDRWVSQRPK